jgi:hypothetical protein
MCNYKAGACMLRGHGHGENADINSTADIFHCFPILACFDSHVDGLIEGEMGTKDEREGDWMDKYKG